MPNLILLTLQFNAQLLCRVDQDLHLSKAVAIDDVTICQKLLLSESTVDLKQLHLLEDCALATLTRALKDRRHANGQQQIR